MSQLAFTFFGARIDFSEFHSGKHFTVITMPAADSFSHPTRYKLSSVNPIGNPGLVVDVQVAISGIVREKRYPDKQTGQMKTYQEADVFFNVIGSAPSSQPVQNSAPVPDGVAVKK